jgi:anaerobic selenocysteine-containing dehydrogenase
LVEDAGNSTPSLRCAKYGRCPHRNSQAGWGYWQSLSLERFSKALGKRLEVFASKRGSIQAGDFEEFWKTLIDRGGWWDPPYAFGQWKKRFDTPSGKFEFFSQTIEKGLNEAARKSSKTLGQVLKELRIEAADDLAFLPHFEKPRSNGDEKEYPFHVINYKLMTMAEGRPISPSFRRSSAYEEAMGLMVEISRNGAGDGIGDGDLVWVESKAGKIKAGRALPSASTSIHIPYGQGHRDMADGRDRGVLKRYSRPGL